MKTLSWHVQGCLSVVLQTRRGYSTHEVALLVILLAQHDIVTALQSRYRWLPVNMDRAAVVQAD
jgi:hypothetical protein